MKKKVDRLAHVMKGLPKKSVERTLKKSETLNIRITEADKLALQQAARSLNTTTTEFVTRAALLVAERLRR